MIEYSRINQTIYAYHKGKLILAISPEFTLAVNRLHILTFSIGHIYKNHDIVVPSIHTIQTLLTGTLL